MSLISKENIQKFVPQYPPFLMVDTLESFEEKKAISTFTILNSNILLVGNSISSPTLTTP
jgi:3-hydroxymyristoyl/3-hydroxydecanoyl-(acyl carrier protein) dehydratase